MAHSPPPSRRDVDMDVDGVSDDEKEEWSESRILSALQSGRVSVLESVAALATSGELRDFEGLFTSAPFFTTLARCLRQAWREHDHHALGGGDDAEAAFAYALELERAAERRGHRQIVDDEEDELNAEPATSQAWRKLKAVYTIIARVLLVPEMSPSVASSRGAIDSAFAGALLARFEPKFRKQPSATSSVPLHGSLTSVTGPGGVGGSSPSAAASASGRLAHVPASILSMVGIGVAKHSEPDSPQPHELSMLRGLVHSMYLKLPTLRPSLRALLGNSLARFLRAPQHPQGINELLQIYGAIAKGFSVPLHPQHRDFLLKSVMPLHQPHQMLNELAPVLSAYHESLVYVLVQFLEKDAAAAAIDGAPPGTGTLCETIMTRILLGWPNARAANSPKEVLLLHECERILEHCTQQNGGASSPTAAAASSAAAPSSLFHRIITTFLPYVIQCISSYNHRVAERALQLWQNDKFQSLCSSDRATVLPALLPCLVDEQKHWNKSVNKMRGIVLGIFRDLDLVLFTLVAHQHFLQLARTAGQATAFTPSQSLARIDALIASLRPPEALVQQTAEQQLLETQVRVAAELPSQVKYSDFVFGHVLGEGSFSCVRYAKWIQRGSLPSAWPEFAVKILNKELVAQQKYEANVAREIRIMNTLAHENINRLVALCENATNTYLVLEYASKGDLHSHITKLGSLDTDSARFVAAEILRALEEIHRNEIVFADLKPENCLIHKSGHLKLSDFGSSRFFSEVSGEDRLEGTAEYLAPEVLRGEAVSPASDLWAFAVCLYQLLAGRTPIWNEDPVVSKAAQREAAKAAAAEALAVEKMTPAEKLAHRAAQMEAHNASQKAHLLKKMVAFEAEQEDNFPENFDPAARDLIEQIMRPDPAQRIGVRSRAAEASMSSASGVRWLLDYGPLKAHPFFASIPWATLHTLPAPSLAGGGVAPAPDAVWARRKNSIMWAPMPKSYTFTEAGGVMELIKEDRAAETAAPDGTGSLAAGGPASGSLRAQLFANKTGSLAAPKFASLQEGDDEGDDMEEGEEEEEGEDEDMEDDDSGPSSMSSRMMTAPLPVAASSALPPRPRIASSRASGPMAVVEPMREVDRQDQDAAMAPLPPLAPVASSAAAPRVRSSIGMRSQLPPSGGGSGPVATQPLPSMMFSSVPRADATAGPTSLGMGLPMRQMGGNSTAASLLGRILNRPGLPPTADLSQSRPQPQ